MQKALKLAKKLSIFVKKSTTIMVTNIADQQMLLTISV